MNQNQRWEILDQLPKSFRVVEDDADLTLVPGTLESWGEALGHPQGKRFCQTCGAGGTCSFRAFYDAMVASVVRELDKQGMLSPPGIHVVRKEPLGDFRLTAKAFHPDDTRGPVTWCEHDDDRHGPEAGCVECRCLHPRGHASSGEISRETLGAMDQVVTHKHLGEPYGWPTPEDAEEKTAFDRAHEHLKDGERCPECDL